MNRLQEQVITNKTQFDLRCCFASAFQSRVVFRKITKPKKTIENMYNTEVDLIYQDIDEKENGKYNSKNQF